MRTLSVVLIFLMIITSDRIFAQQDTINEGTSFSIGPYQIENFQFIIKTDILLPVISRIENRTMSAFTAEFCFNQRHSIQFTGLFNAYSFKGKSDYSRQFIAEYKFFINQKKKYAGFYLGPYFKWAKYSITEEMKGDFPPYYTYLQYDQQSIGEGLISGYQFYIKKHFTIDLLLCFGVRHMISTKIIKAIDIGLENKKKTISETRFALNIGYKF
jgi:hypothetical protein